MGPTLHKRIGAMIRLKRRRALLRMVDIEKKAKGFSKGYLSGIEQGKVNPPGCATARVLAAALEFPPEEFSALCEIARLPDIALKRNRIKEEIESLFRACGEE